MHVNAHLDIDLVAVEQADEVTLMLELRAPPAPGTAQRPPAVVQAVLDRSGSMAGDRLVACLHALHALVARLGPGDSFGLVSFDDEVDVVVPAGPVTDKHAVLSAIHSVHSGGCTNLSAGWLRGVQEARRVANGNGATLLLLSDGHANAGILDHDRLGEAARTARGRGVTTSTIGIGLGYDEQLLSALARGGSGNHVFAEQADAAGPAVAGEVDGLLSIAAQAASLTIRPTGDVDHVRLYNDLPATAIDGGVMVELGDLYAGEQRKLLISLGVPAIAALGLAEIAQLELRYVELPGLVERTVTLPVHVNVVPGDQAAGRVADPTVRSELVYQQAQQDKHRAADALRDGDSGRAAQLYAAAGDALSDAAAAAPRDVGGELREEAALLRDLADRAKWDDGGRLAKFSEADRSRKNRKRGR